jgi:hypothetical protein
MEKPEIVPNISSEDSETVDDMSLENSKKKNAGRRLQDGILSKDPGRKWNLDRRVKNSERRMNSDPDYNGPARRLNIDRRLNLKDRRYKK